MQRKERFDKRHCITMSRTHFPKVGVEKVPELFRKYLAMWYEKQRHLCLDFFRTALVESRITPGRRKEDMEKGCVHKNGEEGIDLREMNEAEMLQPAEWLASGAEEEGKGRPLYSWLRLMDGIINQNGKKRWSELWGKEHTLMFQHIGLEVAESSPEREV